LVVALDLKQITIMVQDWGGPIGLGMAGRQADRIAALVIGNTWAWPAQGDKNMERFSRFMGGGIGHFLIRNFNFFVNILIPVGTVRKLSADEMRAFRGPFRERDAREAVAVLPREILASHDYLAEVEAGLRKLASRPTLIVWGKKDQAFREQQRTRFEQTFPKHRTVLFDNAAHYLQQDVPTEISAEIRRLSAI
jgi:haloalkane dehalogenase